MCNSCYCKSPASQLRWLGGCSVLSIFMSVLGVGLATIGHNAFSSFVDKQLSDNFLLKNSQSGSYAAFVDSDTPGGGVVLTSFYLYNITNAEDVVSGRAPPNVQEIGPLLYIYHNKKYNVTWFVLDSVRNSAPPSFSLRPAGRKAGIVFPTGSMSTTPVRLRALLPMRSMTST